MFRRKLWFLVWDLMEERYEILSLSKAYMLVTVAVELGQSEFTAKIISFTSTRILSVCHSRKKSQAMAYFIFYFGFSFCQKQ